MNAEEASAASAPRQVVNGQRGATAAGTNVWRTILYGTARVSAPTNKPYLQTADDVGITLAGEQSALFKLVGSHATEDGLGVKLIGADGQPGSVGGDISESEPFAVRFRGSDKPEPTARPRIVARPAIWHRVQRHAQ